LLLFYPTLVVLSTLDVKTTGDVKMRKLNFQKTVSLNFIKSNFNIKEKYYYVLAN